MDGINSAGSLIVVLRHNGCLKRSLRAVENRLKCESRSFSARKQTRTQRQHPRWNKLLNTFFADRIGNDALDFKRAVTQRTAAGPRDLRHLSVGQKRDAQRSDKRQPEHPNAETTAHADQSDSILKGQRILIARQMPKQIQIAGVERCSSTQHLKLKTQN